MVKKIAAKFRNYFSETGKLLQEAAAKPGHTRAYMHTAGFRLHVPVFLSGAYQVKEYFFDKEYLLLFSKGEN